METCYHPVLYALTPFHYSAQVLSGGRAGTGALRCRQDHKPAAMMADFFRRFRLCLIPSVPVVFFSPLIQMAAGYHISFSGSRWVSFVLASAILWYGGLPFWQGLRYEIRLRKPGMMSLIVLASGAAYVYSTAVVFGLAAGMDFYWEMALLIVILLWGYWLEMKTVASTSRALERIVRMLPAEADARSGMRLPNV